MSYRLGITDGTTEPSGASVHGDLGLRELEAAGIEWTTIGEASGSADLADLDAVYSMGHRVFDAGSLRSAPRLRHIARFGAGYDSIDLDACSDAGVLVTNTPDAVRRPLALAGLTLILAVTHNLVQKHELTLTGRWQDRGRWRGEHTDGSTIAIVGMGGVGGELAGMLTGLRYRVLGVNRSGRGPGSVEMTDLGTALAAAHVVVLCAPLTSETRNLIGERELALMREDAALVNIGRGELVDQAALTAALRDGVIRAAALDVFAPEPIAVDDPLLALRNVTATPHSLCWTADFTAAVAGTANAAILAVAAGRTPENLLNPRALEHPRWSSLHPIP